jgi:hypothetical protein
MKPSELERAIEDVEAWVFDESKVVSRRFASETLCLSAMHTQRCSSPLQSLMA